MTPGACLICETLVPGPAPEARARQWRAPDGRPSSSLGPTVAVLAIAAVAGLLLVSWVAAFAWAVFRLLELVAVAVVAGWVGWRLGIRHGRRHPR